MLCFSPSMLVASRSNRRTMSALTCCCSAHLCSSRPACVSLSLACDAPSHGSAHCTEDVMGASENYFVQLTPQPFLLLFSKCLS